MTWCNSIYQVILMHRPLNCWKGELISPWARECFKRETKISLFFILKMIYRYLFPSDLTHVSSWKLQDQIIFFSIFQVNFFFYKICRQNKKKNDLWSRINEFYKSTSQLLKSYIRVSVSLFWLVKLDIFIPDVVVQMSTLKSKFQLCFCLIITICCFSTKHAILWIKSMAWNKNNVSRV
jgi:hypothetical protein